MNDLVDIRSCHSHNLNFFSGLVTLDEMKAKQEDVIKKRQLQLAKKNAEARLIEKEKERKKKKEQQKVWIRYFGINIDT